jgi:hypothetical protein
MSNRMLPRAQNLRLSERSAVSAQALPLNHRFDLTQFLLPEALGDEETERWIARQQLPRQLRGLGLEFAFHDVLRRRWRNLLQHLSAGLMVVDDEDRRAVRISDVLVFYVRHDLQETEAGAVDGNCLRWFGYDAVRPLPAKALTLRLLRSERTYVLQLPEHLLSQTLPEAHKDDRYRLHDLKYFPSHAFDYAGGRVMRRMTRMFLSRPFNEFLCRALALNGNDLMTVLRARPAKAERYALDSFFWNLSMQHRELLRAVATARPTLLPLFGAMLKANRIKRDDSPESLLNRLSIYPANLRIRYQRNPCKRENY